MLAVANRLSDASSFREVTRRGRRAASRCLVVHVLAVEGAGVQEPRPARCGLVVSRAVGNSVVRNRVKRRLRHLMRERLGSLPAGCGVVIRALPASAAASWPTLAQDLDRCLDRTLAGPDGGAA